MKIAWNEMKYQPKKFILISELLITIHVMVEVLVRLDKWIMFSIIQIDDSWGLALHPL